MAEILSKNTSKEDVEGIKEDIKNLTKRLGNLKDHSVEELSEQIGDLFSFLKDKGMGIGKSNVTSAIKCLCQSPIKTFLGAFSIGIIAAFLMKK